MPATSLVKFMDKTNGGARGRLWWHRADIDGAPFRGTAPPIAPAEELEERLVRVCDPNIRLFDLAEPKDAKAYVEVLDQVANGMAQVWFVKRVITRNRKTDRIRVRVYLEWVVPYMEDGQPFHAQRPYLGRPNDN